MGLLMWVTCAAALTPADTRRTRQQVTMDFLYEACGDVEADKSRGMIPYFDCESYVYGVLDAYLSIRESIPKSQRACFPADLAPWQAIEIAHPLAFGEQSSKAAAPVLIEALRKTYPCSGK